MLCFFVSCYSPGLYYKHTSRSLTCSKSDINLGMPVTQCPSIHCTKRLLDGVDTNRGLVLGKQREQIGIFVNTDYNVGKNLLVHIVHRK